MRDGRGAGRAITRRAPREARDDRRGERLWQAALAPPAPDAQDARVLSARGRRAALHAAAARDRAGAPPPGGMARARVPPAWRALRRRPRRVRAALARDRRDVELRSPQPARARAQRVVPDRAPAADGPAHARLRADPGPLVPPRRARAGLGAQPLSTSPIGVRIAAPSCSRG